MLDLPAEEGTHWMHGGPASYISANVIYAMPAIRRFSCRAVEPEIGPWLPKGLCCSLGLSLVVSFSCVKPPIVG